MLLDLDLRDEKEAITTALEFLDTASRGTSPVLMTIVESSAHRQPEPVQE